MMARERKGAERHGAERQRARAPRSGRVCKRAEPQGAILEGRKGAGA